MTNDIQIMLGVVSRTGTIGSSDKWQLDFSRFQFGLVFSTKIV